MWSFAIAAEQEQREQSLWPIEIDGRILAVFYCRQAEVAIWVCSWVHRSMWTRKNWANRGEIHFVCFAFSWFRVFPNRIDLSLGKFPLKIVVSGPHGFININAMRSILINLLIVLIPQRQSLARCKLPDSDLIVDVTLICYLRAIVKIRLQSEIAFIAHLALNFGSGQIALPLHDERITMCTVLCVHRNMLGNHCALLSRWLESIMRHVFVSLSLYLLVFEHCSSLHMEFEIWQRFAW